MCTEWRGRSQNEKPTRCVTSCRRQNCRWERICGRQGWGSREDAQGSDATGQHKVDTCPCTRDTLGVFRTDAGKSRCLRNGEEEGLEGPSMPTGVVATNLEPVAGAPLGTLAETVSVPESPPA